MYLFLWILLIFLIIKLYQKFTCGLCKCKDKLTNKVVIVTGANTGIGFETAKELARRDAKVIIACRNEEKGISARDKIINETGNKNVVFKPLDLSSFKSVRDFAADIIKTEPKMNILINNAGVGKLDNSLTQDGLPIEAQTNHFGPFLLTKLLLPLMKKSAPSRIINVSSILHRLGTIDLEAFHKPAKNAIKHMRVYSNTKLANVLFTKKLSVDLRNSGVTANCLHPGAVSTDIFRNRSSLTRFILKLIFKNPWEGAQTSIHLAVSPHLETVNGKYFSDCRETSTSSRANDYDLAIKLWDLSEEVVKSKSE